jgi:hypothetical protein
MIDGLDAGVSPLAINRITTGNHTLNVSAAGYTSQEVPVHVSVNQTRTINLELVPLSTFSELWVAVVVIAIILAGLIGVLLIVKYRSHHH